MNQYFSRILAVGLMGIFIASSSSAAMNDPGIMRRETKQQNRINQGINSGQLTPGEAGRLEAQQARIIQREKRMAARNNGTLTAQDKAKLTRQQNRASRDIYRLKHNNLAANTGR